MTSTKRRSHDWTALKMVFFASEYTAVPDFLKAKGINPASGNALRQTKGGQKKGRK